MTELLLPALLLAAPRPPVLAYYYTWYTTPFGAGGRWGHWSSEAKGLLAPNGTDAATFLLEPAIRHLSSGAYPLIGPYDSMEREVVRWHIRCAKAAGVDAFLVDWWGPAGWQTPAGWTHDVFYQTVLPVAEEEGFQVVLFDETPQFVDNLENVTAWTIDALRRAKDSPAWLRLDGKPVWAIYQLWEGKLSPEQCDTLIRAVEAEVGEVYWIVDKLRAHADEQGIRLYCPDEWLALEAVDCYSGYAMFSTWRVDTYDGLAPLYRDYTAQVHAAGKQVMLPVHPGHDNRRMTPEPYWMERRDGRTYRDFWRAAVEAGCDYLGVTSWNEWPETTVIEPSWSWPDPYQYLRLTAELAGRPAFEPPPLPPAAVLDPPMAELLQARGWLGE